MQRTILLFFSLFIFILIGTKANAQQGTRLYFWGGPQFVSLVNFDDYISYYGDSKLDRLPTYRAGGGVDLVYNFTGIYGVQSGVYYSQQGQKYSGRITRDYNLPNKTDTSATAFNSHIYLNYIRVPLMFRFSSELDDQDRVNLSIFGGVQLGFLQNVQEVVTDPGPPDTIAARYPDFDFKQLYKKTDFGMAAGFQFNIKITNNVGTMIGIRYDRSFGTIEKLSYNLPKDAPAEWQYPVSTKKRISTDRSTRYATRISAVNLFTGISINLGGGGKSSKSAE
jgi:hypothetical protein